MVNEIIIIIEDEDLTVLDLTASVKSFGFNIIYITALGAKVVEKVLGN